MGRKTAAVLAFVLAALGGCDFPDQKNQTTKVASPQTIGGYTFTLIGDLEDGTSYRRLVWEVKAPDGSKTILIRGYGAVENATEKRGKSSVSVEK